MTITVIKPANKDVIIGPDQPFDRPLPGKRGGRRRHPAGG